MEKQNQKADEIDITFYVPCLNEEKNIVNTIETIVEASRIMGLKYEILVFDDRSEDNTIGVVENYQKKQPYIPIKLIKNKETMGLGHNYVEGAFIGKGKYYLLVCGGPQMLCGSIPRKSTNSPEAWRGKRQGSYLRHFRDN